MGKRTERQPERTGDGRRGRLDEHDVFWLMLLVGALLVNAYVIYCLKVQSPLQIRAVEAPRRPQISRSRPLKAVKDTRTPEEVKDGLPPWDGHSEDESQKKDESGCPPDVVCHQ